MAYLRQIEPDDVAILLPDAGPLSSAVHDRRDRVFMCACGFEDRCLAAPRRLADLRSYSAERSIFIQYATNTEENTRNLEPLLSAMGSFSRADPIEVPFEPHSDMRELETALDAILGEAVQPTITFDISSCSAELLLTCLRLLLQRDIRLRILYTEAATYFPTGEQLSSETTDACGELSDGIASEISHVEGSPYYPEWNPDNLPDLLVAFASWNPQRVRSVIPDVKPKQVIWIVGIPHLEENRDRIDRLMRVNGLGDTTEQVLRVSTFDYRDTWVCLEKLYAEWELTHNLVLAPFGSKLQNVGVGLFCSGRRDVALRFATPEVSHASQYSESVREVWEIDLRATGKLRETILSSGRLRIV